MPRRGCPDSVRSNENLRDTTDVQPGDRALEVRLAVDDILRRHRPAGDEEGREATLGQGSTSYHIFCTMIVQKM